MIITTNNIQKNITSISKVIDLVQSLITPTEKEGSYTPRPLYKRFED